MAALIEDYGLIGDLQTAALVSRHGSIDWLCFPRFDSGACFASLLGDEENGRWELSPDAQVTRASRRYRQDTLVLETELETADGTVRLIDFMPPRGEAPDVVRIVEGVKGTVAMRMSVSIRFDYGSIIPWVRRRDDGILAIAGPDALFLATPVELEGRNFHTVAEFDVREGERVPFVLTWYPSHHPPPERVDPEQALADTESFWQEWVTDCTHAGRFREPLVRSLVTLKALTYAPTGGIVAAATTSLPEALGGVRNWDYRYCWLRDATLTLLALVRAGYEDEARAWRDWLLRAIAGLPDQLQIMYGLGGERRLTELELEWLDGYEGSRPVRIGNAASDQLQLDVYGEVADALYHSRVAGLEPLPEAWALNRKLLEWLEEGWRQPDQGIWEVRGPRRHFTHSKVMAWVAFDRARAQRRGVRPRRAGRPLESASRRDPRGGLPGGLRRGARRVHPVLRLAAARRQRADHAPRRLSPRGRRARRRDGRRGRARARPRRVRRTLSRRRRKHRSRRAPAR